MHQEQCGGAPICLSVAPCSVPSRRGLETSAPGASTARRPALTAPARGARRQPQAGTKERPMARTKELHR